MARLNEQVVSRLANPKKFFAAVERAAESAKSSSGALAVRVDWDSKGSEACIYFTFQGDEHLPTEEVLLCLVRDVDKRLSGKTYVACHMQYNIAVEILKSVMKKYADEVGADEFWLTRPPLPGEEV